MRRLLLGSLVLAMSASAQDEPTRLLTLEQAVAAARAKHPLIRQSHAASEVAGVAADRAIAPMLPQIDGTGRYQRTSANFVLRPGNLPRSVQRSGTDATFKTFNFYSFGVTASQLLYDFGQTRGAYRAATEGERAQEDAQRATRQAVELAARTAFFASRAQRALVGVASENLNNQQRHLAQVQAFVDVGTRPAIELAQARTDVSNARVQQIQAENAYAMSKAKLNQAMGEEGFVDYDVADDTLPPLPEEELPIETLLRMAFESRAELAVLESKNRAQRLVVRSVKGGYGPTLSATTGVTEAGIELKNMTWNWNAGVFLVWPLFEGGSTRALVREARANQENLMAQLDALRQQVRVELEQARLGVRAAKAVVDAEAEAQAAARERLKLAEGRYAAGVGDLIELGDAQLSFARAEAQKVGAEYDLSAARALLINALGREK